MLRTKNWIGLLLIFVLDFIGNFPLIGICVLFFGAISLCFHFLFHLIFKKNYDYRPTFICGMFILLEVVSLIGWNRFQTNYALQQSNKIIAALEVYKERKGVYPETLEELVPMYLKEVPKPKIVTGMGWPGFHYGRDFNFQASNKTSERDPKNYYLMFHNFGFATTSYYSKKKTWSTMD